MTRPRLDSRQRRALEILTTEWQTAEWLSTQTALYRSAASLSTVLYQLALPGLVEGRHQGSKVLPTEWRITPAGQAFLMAAPVVAGEAS